MTSPSRNRRPRHRLLPAALALLAILPPAPAAAPGEPTAAPSPRGRIGEFQQARPGPWGPVEYTRIVIEPPDEFMAEDYPPQDRLAWKFPGYTRAELAALWTEAGLDATRVAALRAPGVVTVTPAGITVRPPAALVRDLPAAARGRIYNTLAALPGNPAQELPFRFREDLVDEWLDEPTLPAPALAEVRRLLYRRANSALFSDADLVLPLLPTPALRVRLVKTLSRKSTLLARLRLDPLSDVDALADYWGRGPRRKDVKPLLRSLTRHPQGLGLDIVHLLPRFARGLLYTYPPGAGQPDPTLDCHWTTMNFFRDEPDRRFADVGFVLTTLEREFEPLPDDAPRRFGDVVLLARPGGEIFHSCIHLFDDIVFTKNGYAPQTPWVLATVRDVLAAYPLDTATAIRVYRRRE